MTSFFRTFSDFFLFSHVTFFYPLVRYLAFDVSDFLSEIGGLMGLLACISVFFIIELLVIIIKGIRFAACKFKVAPETIRMRKPRKRRRFLVNRNHLFYHLGQTFGEFLKESNIYGMHYNSDKNFKTIERIAWFIIICVLMALCSVLVLGSLNKLLSNSVMLALDEKIWNVEDVRLSKILSHGESC